MRRRLAEIVVALLVTQVSILVATPLALCAGMSAPTTEQACTCSHGTGQCPMHHHEGTPFKPPCSCRSTDNPASTTVAALLSPPAVLAGVTDSMEPIACGRLSLTMLPFPLNAFVQTDSPPPRS